MLSPSELQGIANDLTQIYSKIEDECIASIVKRITAGKKITEASMWQMKKLDDVGALKRDLLQRIKKETGLALPEVRRLVEKSLTKSLDADVKALTSSLKTSSGLTKAELFYSIRESDAFKRILSNAVAGCKSAMNLTATKALQASVSTYTSTINRAYLKMASGNYSYSDCVRDAVSEIGKSGIRIVDGKKDVTGTELVRGKNKGELFTTYGAGSDVRLYPLDSAIRRDLTTQINQSCGELTLHDCDELDTQLVVTSWHTGARPEHEEWQGKVFSLKAGHPKYPYFYDPQEKGGTGYGTAEGLCGINCYHSFNPYFDGDEINNDDQPSPEENAKAYREQQQQRTYERNLRSLKRQQVALREGGFTEEAQKVQGHINRVNANYRKFLDETGRTRVSMLDSVGGYHPIKAIEPPTPAPAKPAATKVAEVSKVVEDVNRPKLAGVVQGEPMTFEQADAGRANPRFRDGGKPYRNNCQTCVVAHEARRRGFDVEAMPRVTQHQEDLAFNTRLAWKDSTGHAPMPLTNGNVATNKQLVKWFEDTVEEGERYHLNVFWKNYKGGHIVCLERINGTLTMFDPQNAEISSGSEKILNYFNSYRIRLRQESFSGTYRGMVKLYRVDNLEFNMDYVNDIMREATT